MTRAKRSRPLSDEEEAEIQKMIAEDPDNPEWTGEEFRRAKRGRDVLPATFLEAVKRLPGPRGPGKTPAKELVTLRLDRDVVEHFKAKGERWRTRINETLKKAIADR